MRRVSLTATGARRDGHGPPRSFNEHNQHRNGQHQGRGGEQGVPSPRDLCDRVGQPASEDRTEEAAGANEGEKPPRLPRVENLVGVRPEL